MHKNLVYCCVVFELCQRTDRQRYRAYSSQHLALSWGRSSRWRTLSDDVLLILNVAEVFRWRDAVAQEIGVDVVGSAVLHAVSSVEFLSDVPRRPVVVLFIVPRLELHCVHTPRFLAIARQRSLQPANENHYRATLC